MSCRRRCRAGPTLGRQYGFLADRSSESDSRERSDEILDRIGEVDLRDVVVAAGEPKPVGVEEDLRVGEAGRRLEAVRRQLDREPERVVEVDRIHEPSILDAAVLDPARAQPLDGLIEGRLRERDRDVVHAAGVGRGPSRIRCPVLVREHRDQATVARIEVQMALLRVVEVRLLEHERHPEQPLPEVDRRLPVGADERDVVHALALELLHQPAPSRSRRSGTTSSGCG